MKSSLAAAVQNDIIRICMNIVFLCISGTVEFDPALSTDCLVRYLQKHVTTLYLYFLHRDQCSHAA